MKPSLKYNGKAGTKGFTIIELLVAVGVTALMVSLMLTIVVNVLNGWNKSSGTLNSGNQARLVLDQLSRDLQSAIIKRDTNVWIAAAIQQNQTDKGDAGVDGAKWNPPVSKPSVAGSTDPTSLTTSLVVPAATAPAIPVIDDYRFGQGGVWLRFFTNSPDINKPGELHRISAPRAVAYQIVRLPVVRGKNSEQRYQLFRSEVRPGHADATLAARSTFAVGYNLLDPASGYNVASDSPNSGVLIDGSGVDQGGEPGSIRRPDRNQLIANNVIDFGIRFWVRNPATNVLEIGFPKTTGDLKFAATTNTAGAAVVGYTNVGFPEIAEVFVRILTDEGVNQISNLENELTPNTPGKWWEIALANSKVFTRRIEIKSNSL